LRDFPLHVSHVIDVGQPKLVEVELRGASLQDDVDIAFFRSSNVLLKAPDLEARVNCGNLRLIWLEDFLGVGFDLVIANLGHLDDLVVSDQEAALVVEVHEDEAAVLDPVSYQDRAQVLLLASKVHDVDTVVVLVLGIGGFVQEVVVLDAPEGNGARQDPLVEDSAVLAPDLEQDVPAIGLAEVLIFDFEHDRAEVHIFAVGTGALEPVEVTDGDRDLGLAEELFTRRGLGVEELMAVGLIRWLFGNFSAHGVLNREINSNISAAVAYKKMT
jgi:hypothetical protein